MTEAVELMDTVLDDSEVFVEADLEFHLALAQATQNPIIPRRCCIHSLTCSESSASELCSRMAGCGEGSITIGGYWLR